MDGYKIDKKQFEWEYDVNLLKTPFFLSTTLKVYALVYSIIIVVVSLFFLFNYGIDIFIYNLPWIFMIIGILFSINIIIFIFKMKKNFRLKFTLTDYMLYIEMMDKIIPNVKNNLILSPGIILHEMIKKIDETDNYTPIFKEMSSTQWSSVAKVIYHPYKKIISLRINWRNMLNIYCTDENYLTIETFVKGKIYKKIGL